MRIRLTIALIFAAVPCAVRAQGLLLPADRTALPLALVSHKVRITLEDQVAITHVEQVFRNRSDRPLEASFVFPVPEGASVNRFTLWVDGKETAGELLESAKAHDIYTQIVRRTRDPGLLEYFGNRLLRVSVFPVPANGEQKIALEYTSVATADSGVVEYVYPLKASPRMFAGPDEFALTATIRSQRGVANVFSPAHAVAVRRLSEREVQVTFEPGRGVVDGDFQLIYSISDQRIGLAALAHRRMTAEDGYFALLITPRFTRSTDTVVPRDLVLVLDTSGSMRGPKMNQARRALKYCLDHLAKSDRFALINFATTVNKFRNEMSEGSVERIDDAKRWIDTLEAVGGTAIDNALSAALAFRSDRPLTVLFFTDGEPTIGETNIDKILEHVAAGNSAGTRIFTFGVGDDVNAAFLDRLAERSRAVSTYVRPEEDIEAKASGLYAKISGPVLTDIKLSVGPGAVLSDIYPPVLPDLYRGGQLTLFGRYSGGGSVSLQLAGQAAIPGESGSKATSLTYQVQLPDKTGNERSFVEQIWANRKAGYLLEQIRSNGEKTELVDELVRLAKRHGIATPYTSYLVVPDGPLPAVPPVRPGIRPPPRLVGGIAREPAGKTVLDLARAANGNLSELAARRGTGPDQLPAAGPGMQNADSDRAQQPARLRKTGLDQAREALAGRRLQDVQIGKSGVDFSLQIQELRGRSRLNKTASRNVLGRNLLEIDGIWIDYGFNAKTPTIAVKAQSDAYFRILEMHPEVKDLFASGNRLVWVGPAGTALVVDTMEGEESISDAAIERLFAPK